MADSIVVGIFISTFSLLLLCAKFIGSGCRIVYRLFKRVHF